MFVKRQKNSIIYYTSNLLEKAGFTHMFCTRYHGVSSGDFESLNFSTVRKDSAGNTDSPAAVYENYRLALGAIGILPENACAAHQIHSDIVREVSSSDAGCGTAPAHSEIDGCDALLLRKDTENIRAVCVKTADCVPILLADKRTGSVCAVHAGWRGSASDIAAKAALRLNSESPENIVAAIGPCIGSCCYEVGDEVYTAFQTLFSLKGFPDELESLSFTAPVCSLGGKKHIDLARINKRLLEISGIPGENIDISGICTCCFSENGVHPFFSHRASHGHSGTFLSAISCPG